MQAKLRRDTPNQKILCRLKDARKKADVAHRCDTYNHQHSGKKEKKTPKNPQKTPHVNVVNQIRKYNKVNYQSNSVQLQ